MNKPRGIYKFENLIVYQKAKMLSIEILRYFGENKTSRQHDFIKSQLFRATCSVGANIAEGFGRYYNKSYRQFLAISIGSAFEVNYWLEISSEMNMIEKPIYDKFLTQNEELIKILTALMKNKDN